MAPSSRRVDRRMQRTRQVLEQAFMDVAHEKGLVATTIQDITERADVNRGTFYLHFADKYMLMDTIIRQQFQHHLAGTLPPVSLWDRRTVHQLIEAVLEYFEGKYRHQPHSSHVFVSLFEQVIREELTALLTRWLNEAQRGPVPPETIARIVSSAILGTAIQWSQEETTTSSEQMAHDIFLVAVEGMARLAPFTRLL